MGSIMIPKALTESQIRALLLKNWMTHDALWYREAALKLGMAAASPMNLRVCRKLGRIEVKRLMQALDVAPPSNMDEFRELFETGRQVFVPDFMSFKIDYPDENVQRFTVLDCFAHRGMEKAGLLPEYECGIFERIFGWLDAMNLTYTATPDLSRCLKYKGEECIVTLQFDFKNTGQLSARDENKMTFKKALFD